MQVKSLNIHGLSLICAEFGRPEAFPVFYFHGFPGCHTEGELLGFKQLTMQLNCRIICIDRPGMGGSEFDPDRRLTDWPATVAAVADRLGIGKFSVMGLSGGGPYALAAACMIPDRLYAATVVSGMAPCHYPESHRDLAMSLPKQPVWLRKPMAGMFRAGVKHTPLWLARQAVNILSEADRRLFSNQKILRRLLYTYSTALAQGVRGYVHEASIYRNYWGFDPADIMFPVQLWHGTADRNVRIISAGRMADELADCRRTFIRGEGHFSLIVKYPERILKESVP
ncbi:MAG: alpha/beta fold hydrolase [Bacteroidales bacterium]